MNLYEFSIQFINCLSKHHFKNLIHKNAHFTYLTKKINQVSTTFNILLNVLNFVTYKFYSLLKVVYTYLLNIRNNSKPRFLSIVKTKVM